MDAGPPERDGRSSGPTDASSTRGAADGTSAGDRTAPGGAAGSRSTPGAASGGESRSADPAVPAVRASDDERHRMVEALGEHAAAGRISLAELEERVGRAYAAASRGELAELTRDLPALTEPSEPAEPARRGRASQWLIAIMGGSNRRTRRLAQRVNAVSIMGGDELDLREVEIQGDELTINAVSLMGGLNIYVPDSVEVELSGFAIMGGNDERGSLRSPRPGAPVIRVKSFALMGGVEVWRLPAESRGLGLRAARRAAKALERGSSS